MWKTQVRDRAIFYGKYCGEAVEKGNRKNAEWQHKKLDMNTIKRKLLS